MKTRVVDYIADYLVQKGIHHVFTITGGGAMHLNDAFGHHEKLESIYNHHEQACAMAAESYTRMTGKLALVCVTSGPGGTNALTGVLGGWLDSIPMFIISGQVKRETTIRSTPLPLRQLGDQEFNITDCVKSMTKYAEIVMDETTIKYHLDRAWFEANNGRGGPVWLDIPLDVQAALIDPDQLQGWERPKNDDLHYDEGLTPIILKKILEAKKPIVFAGSGIRLSNSHNEFLDLISKLNIPVVTAWNAHDVLWDNHPLYCGRPGTIGNRGGNFVVENADLILVLGSRLNIRQISYNFKNFAVNSYKIMVDIDDAELNKPTLNIDLKVHANVKDVIHSLSNYLDNSDLHITKEKWLSWCRTINQNYPTILPKYLNQTSPLNPYAFMGKLFEVLPEGKRIVTSNGSACVISFQAGSLKKNQRLYTNSGCASMGYGLPAALGAYVSTHEQIICLEGDGSIQMNLQELQTIKHNNMNIIIMVLNNNGYHSIRQTQRNLTKKAMVGVNKDNGVSFPDFEKIAYAYDIKYVRMDNLNQITQQVQTLLDVNEPILCEVILDENQNFEPKLSSKVLEDGTIVSPRIDDMFPFLDREEYEACRYGE